jgi:oligopeptide transport system substrate-binding protein
MRFNFVIAVIILFFVGCRDKVGSDKQVFTYNETTGIASLDPAFAKNQSTMWAAHQLYNTLVEIDTALNIVPSVAKRWEVSTDNLTYTFYLRNDVYFHDDPAFVNGKGRRLTAFDVEYSLKRILDKSVASSGGWIFNNRIDTLNGFKALNDTTFQLKLIRPFHPIMGILSMQYCSLVPKEVAEKYGKDFRRHPVGTGPFKFKTWAEGQALIMEKNEKYWERDEAGQQLPYLDAVKVSFYDNKATEFLQFRQHKLSFINDIDPSFKDEVLSKKGELRPEWNGNIVMNTHPYLNTEYLGILVQEKNEVVSKSPLNIKKVRQAINSSIDRKKLMMYVRNSIGLPAESGFVPGGLPSRNVETVKGYPFDPVKARQLLNEAGYFSKFSNYTIKLITIPIYADIGSFIAKQMEDIGMKVQVEVIQKSLLLEQTAKSQASFFRGSWIADYPDAENYMAMFYSKNPAPPNYTRYSNPAFDVLYEKALMEADDSVRYALYRQMDQIVIDDAPVVPIWYDVAIHFVQPEVEGFKPNALNLLELRRVRVK